MSTKNNIVGITSIEYDDSKKYVVEINSKAKTEKIFDTKDNLLVKRLYKLDSNGQLKLIRDSEHVYDGENRHIKNISKNMYGVVVCICNQEYNDKGNIIKNNITILPENITHCHGYEYDDNDILIKKLFFDENSVLTLYKLYTYDGDTTNVKTYTVDNGVEKLFCEDISRKMPGLNDATITIDIYKSDAITQEIHTESVGDRLVKKYIMTNGVKTSDVKYDMLGNMTLWESTNHDGSITTELYKFENVYNEAGDLILQIKQDLTGQDECLSAKDIIKYIGVN